MEGRGGVEKCSSPFRNITMIIYYLAHKMALKEIEEASVSIGAKGRMGREREGRRG